MKKNSSLKTLDTNDKIKIINVLMRGVKCKRDISIEVGLSASKISTIFKPERILWIPVMNPVASDNTKYSN